MREQEIRIQEINGEVTEKTIQIEQVLVVGYGGRDLDKIHEHIDELKEIGVAPPETIPELYPQKTGALNMDEILRVQGTETSGEVEYVLFNDGEEWLVTIGSDHTDRKMEAVSGVLAAKAACEKPLSSLFWRLRDIEAHWDQLILRSSMTVNGSKRLYQEHNLTALLQVPDLLAKLDELNCGDLTKTIIFSGTVPTIGGFVYGEKFEYEIEDPILKRSIQAQYTIVVENPGLN